jgi:transposase
VVLRRALRREQLMEVMASLPPCVVGMEAGSGAHQWARRFQELGHTPKLMAAKFVSAYRRNGKNDGNDAEAICEAVSRPGMRFVPVKSLEQQALLSLHRVRQGFIAERTAIINRLRGGAAPAQRHGAPPRMQGGRGAAGARAPRDRRSTSTPAYAR